MGAELEGVAAAACSHQEEGAVEFLALSLLGYFLSHCTYTCMCIKQLRHPTIV